MRKTVLELFATCRSAQEFWENIPRTQYENLDFRKELHKTLADNNQLLPGFIQWCKDKKHIVFDTCLWTYNPRMKPGFQNRPFILRWKQVELVERLCHSIDNGHDIAIDKSRDEGATEVITKLFTVYCLLYDQMYFLIASRKEELVDKSTSINSGKVIGPHQCLMHKILYAIANLPVWWKVNISKSHMFLQNLDNGSVIQGEATNDSLGAGNRATAVLIDEMARVEPDVAQYISDNIRDVTNCGVFNSTHFKWGAGHPYARLLRDDKIEKFVLGWEHNPEKNFGLYKSPKKDMVKIYDIMHYRKACPEVFNRIEPEELIDWTLIRHLAPEVRMISDGGVSNFNCPRSIWFDQETVDRSRSMAGIAQDILRIPQGSADMFFSPKELARYKNKWAKDPEITGRLETITDSTGAVLGVEFQEHQDYTFQYWGDLRQNKKGMWIPNPRHNYIVACDISRGTGASNSVAAVIDVNDCKLVGMYVNGYIDVVDFADLTVGICKWFKNAYLIWEANGPGDTFGKRIIKQGYHDFYWNKDERTESNKKTRKPGWYSTPGVNGSKFAVLSGMDTGMVEGLKDEPLFHYLEIYDDRTIDEMMNYVFAEGRTEVISSDETALTSNEGKFAHGDRVVAVSLGFFALKYQPKRNFVEKRNPPSESFEARRRDFEAKQARKSKRKRKYRYK